MKCTLRMLTEIKEDEINNLIINCGCRQIEKIQNENAMDLKKENFPQKKKQLKKQKDKISDIKVNKVLMNNEFSLESIKHIVEDSSSKGKRPVIMLNDEGIILNVFSSVTEAANDSNISAKGIRDAAI